MMIKFKRIEVGRKFLNIYEDRNILLGFSEHGLELKTLGNFFKVARLIELKQVHSNMIRFSGEVKPGSEGDGIVLERKNEMAIIKTADCVPLFFWEKTCSSGGIVHIGRQGLYKSIEKRLLELLKKRAVNFPDLRFFMGPAVEADCYEVGRELYDKFSEKAYRDEVFYEKKGEKYRMDIKKGIALSLKEEGIADAQIQASFLCTFCEKERFPSYRRDHKTGSRIYNFLLLKPAR
jgi:hypothetical protein